MLAVISNQRLIIKKEETGRNEDRAFLPVRLQYKVKNIFPSENGISCAKSDEHSNWSLSYCIYYRYCLYSYIDK